MIHNGPAPAPPATRLGWQINARADGAEILIYEEIGLDWWTGEGTTAKSFRADLAALPAAAALTVRINSPGGEVFDGFAIYQALKDWAGEVTVHVDGVAASIASVIAMAGQRVVMAGPAMLMIHDPWGYAVGNAAELRKQADVMDKVATSIASAYVERTGRAEADIRAEMSAETWFTADEAVALGFADEVDRGAAVQARHDLSRFRSYAANRTRLAALHRPATEDPEMIRNGPAPAPEPDNPAPQGPTDLPPSPPAVDDPAAPADVAAEARVLARLQARNRNLAAAYRPFLEREGVRELLDGIVADPTVTEQAARDRLLAHLGAQCEPLGGNPVFAGGTRVVIDARDRFRAGATLALLARAGVRPEPAHQAAANEYRGYTLLDLSRMALENSGVGTRGMDPRQIVASAFTQSTSDLPVLLENTLHKLLLEAYRAAPDTWRQFAKIGEVSDFRVHNRLRPGSFSNLDDLAENGEVKRKAVPDGTKATIQAKTKGNIIAVTREIIINNDLQNLVDQSQDLGRAAARTLESDVLALIVGNALTGDGVALCHASHNNVVTSAAPGAGTLAKARAAMRKQKDASGNDYIDPRIAVLLTSVDYEDTFASIILSQTDVSQSNPNARNPVQNLARVVGSPRVTATASYLLANPDDVAAVEVAFLNGVQEPMIESQDGWTTLGSEQRVIFDYAVATQDYRGIVQLPHP